VELFSVLSLAGISRSPIIFPQADLRNLHFGRMDKPSFGIADFTFIFTFTQTIFIF
jgi:hypothetical protein